MRVALSPQPAIAVPATTETLPSSVDEKVILVEKDIGAVQVVQEKGAAGTPTLPPDSDRFLVVSPYPDHLLDLDTLDAQTRLLARALTVFDKVRGDYATAPYADSFNWPLVMDGLRQLAKQEGEGKERGEEKEEGKERPLAWCKRDYFVVAFRSQISLTADCGDLGRLDKAAHREATDSGGLLRYWFDHRDSEGRNLATCIWHSPEDAHRGGRGPAHREAGLAARALYRQWQIERYRLVIDDNVQSWAVVEWVD